MSYITIKKAWSQSLVAHSEAITWGRLFSPWSPLTITQKAMQR